MDDNAVSATTLGFGFHQPADITGDSASLYPLIPVRRLLDSSRPACLLAKHKKETVSFRFHDVPRDDARYKIAKNSVVLFSSLSLLKRYRNICDGIE